MTWNALSALLKRQKHVTTNSEDETDIESDNDNYVDDGEGLLMETEKEMLRSLSLANPLATGEIGIALSTKRTIVMKML